MENNNKEVRIYNKENEDTSTTRFSGFARKLISLTPQYTHHHEILPYTYNSIITMNGKVIDKQAYQRKGSNHKVIYNGDTTIVILEDGTKGVAKCNPSDDYHKYTGYRIAKTRADIKKLQKELKELTK